MIVSREITNLLELNDDDKGEDLVVETTGDLSPV